MKILVIASLMLAVMAGAQGTETTFTGTITDSMCADADHTVMRMGPTDAECTIACIIAHGALYVLYDGEQAFTLSDQEAPEQFAGKKVTVTGTLNSSTRTIEMISIAEAE